MSAHKKYLIVLGGATATGKTALSIEVARHFQTEILSCDSRQFYREMNIGTAKPSPAELAAVPHHFINSLQISDEYSAGNFEKDALALLATLFQKKEVVVLAGGSGLFIRALCEGLDKFPQVPDAVKNAVLRLYQEQGITALQEELRSYDPVFFAQVDQQNPQRLMRALSVCRLTGQPFSSFLKKDKTGRPFKPIYILLQLEREVLYEQINRRVDLMMAAGLLEEARSLYPHRQLNALQTVGYQELFDYFDGKTTLEVAIAKIQQNTRRYAKRQITWFRKDAHWKTFSPQDKDLIIQYIESIVKAV